MRVDAHQHFWSLARGDYGWLEGTPGLEPIQRDFAPHDLAPLLERHGIDRTVLVQAAPSVEETEYLLGIADASAFVGKVVGWIDFEDEEHRRHLARFADHPKFSGLRPMVQDIPDTEWVHRPDIAWAFEAIMEHDLTLDALGFPAHAAPFLRLCERYPDLRVVLDHGLKPQIADDAFEDWAAAMSRLADETGACCKLSGLVTEAAPDWTVEDLRPYVDHILAAFGPERVMWGSDWPVLTLAGDYDRWLAAAEALVPEADREMVFGGTAAAFYRL